MLFQQLLRCPNCHIGFCFAVPVHHDGTQPLLHNPVEPTYHQEWGVTTSVPYVFVTQCLSYLLGNHICAVCCRYPVFQLSIYSCMHAIVRQAPCLMRWGYKSPQGICVYFVGLSCLLKVFHIVYVVVCCWRGEECLLECMWELDKSCHTWEQSGFKIIGMMHIYCVFHIVRGRSSWINLQRHKVG